MKSRKLKQLLEVFRPSGADAKNPVFAKALEEVNRDPKFSRWFADQQRFDRIMAGSLKTLAAPADLKESILASRKVVRPSPSFWRDWRLGAAAAAGFVILATIGLSAMGTRQAPFPEFRSALVDQAWAGNSHLDFESSDVIRIKQWLAGQFVLTDFKLPDGLRNASIIGCRVAENDGHRVPMICLVDGTRHLHLFVVDGMAFTDLPTEGVPDFEKCAGWKTAAWQDGKRTYVLTGMNYQTFVNRFRKSGRWTTAG